MFRPATNTMLLQHCLKFLESRYAWACVLVACVGLLAFGLYLQHVQGLEPCPMCIVQRYAMTVIALLSIAYFVAWSWNEKEAVVDLSLLKGVQYTTGVSMLTIGFMTYYATVVVFPLWLLLVMGYNTVQAGLAIAPIAIFNLVFSPLVGQREDLQESSAQIKAMRAML